jgi:hypothetical protein
MVEALGNGDISDSFSIIVTGNPLLTIPTPKANPIGPPPTINTLSIKILHFF